MKNKNPIAAIAGVVALIGIMMVGVVVLAIRGEGMTANAKALIITNMMVGVFALIPAILALAKSEQVQHDMNNGVMKDHMKDAIQEMADDTENNTVIIQSENYTGPDRRRS